MRWTRAWRILVKKQLGAENSCRVRIGNSNINEAESVV
jgi:hypothetical protein